MPTDKRPLSPRKLSIVHTESSCGWGGQEIRILEESRGLIERGHRVRIVCPAEAQIHTRAKEWGVEAIALPIKKKRWADFRALRAWLKTNRAEIDLINTHSSTDSWLVALANLGFGRDSFPVVRTRHISAPVRSGFSNRWLYGKAAQFVVTTGENLRLELIEGLGLAPECVESIFTGIDTKRYVPGDKLAAREKLGLEAQACWIGIVATLRSWKGHQYLIDAFEKLDCATLRLAIVGDGPQRENLQNYVAAKGLAGKVFFAGNQRDVVPWLQALDIFALPSFANEGVSQAVMQAMSVGLPVVTTPIGSMEDVIKAGATGLLVEPRNVEALSEALGKLIADPLEASRLGEEARRFALDNCDLERMISRMEAIFQRVAG